jgi:hypothetical protein
MLWTPSSLVVRAQQLNEELARRAVARLVKMHVPALGVEGVQVEARRAVHELNQLRN